VFGIKNGAVSPHPDSVKEIDRHFKKLFHLSFLLQSSFIQKRVIMSSKSIDDQQKVDMEKGENDTGSYRVASNTTYDAHQDVLGAEDVNPILMAKMHLVNDVRNWHSLLQECS
jgi:hypothetical protein